MPAFPPVIERWRPFVVAAAPDVPADLALAIIKRESQGVPGTVAYTDVGHKPGSGYSDAERACGLPASLTWRCLGLMQVAPRTWRDYVTRTGRAIAPCDLAGKSTAQAAAQIEIGCSALRAALSAAGWRGEPIPRDEVILMARLVYARGAGAVSDKLAAAAAAGFPRTFAGLEAFDPTWGRPDRPFDGARAVLRDFRAAIGSPSSGPPAAAIAAGGGGAFLLLLALWFFFRR